MSNTGPGPIVGQHSTCPPDLCGDGNKGDALIPPLGIPKRVDGRDNHSQREGSSEICRMDDDMADELRRVFRPAALTTKSIIILMIKESIVVWNC